MQRRVGQWGVDAHGRMDVGAICSDNAVLLAKYAPRASRFWVSAGSTNGSLVEVGGDNPAMLIVDVYANHTVRWANNNTAATAALSE